jgi:hypothetical protein
MSLMTKQELMLLANYVVERTERGRLIIQRDPRQMPRRLRVLLLAIDGGQTVNLYTQTLKGFGDISELLVELINLGMVRLVEPMLAMQQREAGRSDTYKALDNLLDDSKYDSEAAADILYGSTAPGSFDEMLRVARIDHPQYEPPPSPAPAPVDPAAQKAQIESLFALLDSVRGERVQLKHQLAKLQRVREAALRLNNENKSLQNRVTLLGILCAVLAASLLLAIYRR